MLGHWALGQKALGESGDTPIVTTGTLAATEAQDTAAIAGKIVATGTLAATDTQDTPAISGTIANRGSLSATDPQDTAALAGKIVATGSLAATGAQDTAAVAGTVFTSGSLAATDPQDVFISSPPGPITGTLDATDTQDDAAFAGKIVATGTLAATDPEDTAAFSAPSIDNIITVGQSVDDPMLFGYSDGQASGETPYGSFTPADGGSPFFIFSYTADGSSVTIGAPTGGTVTWNGENYLLQEFVPGFFVYIGAGKGGPYDTTVDDTFSFVFVASGEDAITGTLDATEDPDSADMSGDVVNLGSLAATEAQDTGFFFQVPTATGTLDATEAQDTADATGDVVWGTPTVVILTPSDPTLPLTGTYQFPPDWNPANATLEAYGAGGPGTKGFAGSPGVGGGGGAYGKRNIAIPYVAGDTVSFQAGNGNGSSGHHATIFDGTFTTSAWLSAEGGNIASTGGKAANSRGDVVASGGDGATGSGNNGGGGGGSGGPNGNGTTATGVDGAASGQPGNTPGVGGNPGTAGTNGAGGGGGNALSANGGKGGDFGGGGGGGAAVPSAGSTTNGGGANGAIIITYYPVAPNNFLIATEAQDTAAFVGNTAQNGSLAATDAPDTFAAVGLVGIIGTLAATDPQDTAVLADAGFGVLDAIDPQDTAEIVGSIATNGTLDATERQDGAFFSYLDAISGTMAATDTPDVAAAEAYAVPGGATPGGKGYITLVSGNSITLPADFGFPATIRMVGAGGDAGASNLFSGSGAGGGGEYAENLSPDLELNGTYSYGVGANQDTWFGGTSFGDAICMAKKGGNASGTTGGAGGTSSAVTGVTKFSGGKGGDGGTSGFIPFVGGGGGAGGPNGVGGDGGGGNVNAAGGAGDAGHGGAGGSNSARRGGTGTEWSDGGIGSGGGGYGFTTPGEGGYWGGGGGGITTGTGAKGHQGVIYIEYTVAVAGVLFATEARDTALFIQLPPITGTLAATDGQDSASVTGKIVATGTMAATDPQDMAYFSSAALGTLAATEAQDTALFAENLRPQLAGIWVNAQATISNGYEWAPYYTGGDDPFMTMPKPTENGAYVIKCDDAGDNQDMDIMARVRSAGLSNATSISMIIGTYDDGFRFDVMKDNYVRIIRNGVVLYTATYTWPRNTWFYVRCRVRGPRLFMKVWREQDVEPNSWLINESYPDMVYVNRAVGLIAASTADGAASCGPYDVAYFSAGQNLRSAPIPG